MLLKSLHYFWLKFWGAADAAGATRISGETYWLYRMHAEAAFFLSGYVALFGSLFMSAPAEIPLANRIALACVFAFIGAVEWLWLRIALREQLEFAHLFYG